MTEDDSARRISLFIVGFALTTFFGVSAYVLFSIVTAMMNPSLSGPAYWDGVRERLATNPEFAITIALSVLGAVFGLVFIAKSFMKRPATH